MVDGVKGSTKGPFIIYGRGMDEKLGGPGIFLKEEGGTLQFCQTKIWGDLKIFVALKIS